MRRALAFLLIVSLLGGQLGMLGALLGRHQARQQTEREIDAIAADEHREAGVTYMRLSRAEREASGSSFVQVDEGEFRYRGKLYDVVREAWEGSVWHVWVIRDREEEQYLDALAEAVGSTIVEGGAAPMQERPVAYRPVAVVSEGPPSVPSPSSGVQSFLRASVIGHEAPYLKVPHPPPWA